MTMEKLPFGFYDDYEVCAKNGIAGTGTFSGGRFKKSIGVSALAARQLSGERADRHPSVVRCVRIGSIPEKDQKLSSVAGFAKLSARLVPNQDYRKISVLFKDYFEKAAPPTVKVEVKPHHGGQAYVCPIDLPAYRAAEKAFTEIYGRRPLPVRSGGSIPIVATFEEVLGVKSVLMGFGLKSDAIHSPNERFSLDRFYKGIATIVRFYQYFAGS